MHPRFTLPGASEPNCSFSTSELMTVSGSHFRSGRRKSALGRQESVEEAVRAGCNCDGDADVALFQL